MMLENSNNRQEDVSAVAAVVTSNVTVHFATKDLPVICATPVDGQELLDNVRETTKGYLSKALDTPILSKP